MLVNDKFSSLQSAHSYNDDLTSKITNIYHLKSSLKLGRKSFMQVQILGSHASIREDFSHRVGNTNYSFILRGLSVNFAKHDLWELTKT